ncbi:XRE family transcriptional regulator [Leptolyngbyaceae cyanobacterium CCMR0082]|uniref:XRE family transcriptional regulator n=2 Tax=Adonisia turfae TaxID=2950184 RepID=A0A6M0SE57_9CYAN|nr:helix-turn-helix transcriptional regulator [Adonisia turfae]NEZ56504.1 XRE family transcriptional regulator [Adonisia turfae CCMR0081]NEZ66261.1 XRE family transcriptional regulator [Adonisia turfae CCMR0082]
MKESNVNQEGVVLKQLRNALGGISQEALSKMIGCSVRKIWRGENGTEPTWTTIEAKNLHLLLERHFGVGITHLPDSLKSSDPVPFLQEAIAQKNAEV